MQQFAVFANPGASARRAPYLLNIQSELFDSSSLVVAPLAEPDYFGPAVRRLNPTLMVGAQPYVLSVLEMASVSRHRLGHPIGDLSSSRDEIAAALDMLFTGV